MNGFALPLFLTRRTKYLYSAIWVVLGASLYLSSNHCPFFAPRQLPMTLFDQSVPFLPWTVWIYSSEMFLFFTVYGFSRDIVNANKYLYSFLALQVFSVTIFLLWPTIYPRGDYPLPADLGPWTLHVFRNLRDVDAPSNCLPSLHVSSCYLSAFVYLDEQREKFPIFFLWATAIACSTLTTKQHYLVDVIAGMGSAILMYIVFHRLMPYRTLDSPGEAVVNLLET